MFIFKVELPLFSERKWYYTPGVQPEADKCRLKKKKKEVTPWQNPVPTLLFVSGSPEKQLVIYDVSQLAMFWQCVL